MTVSRQDLTWPFTIRQQIKIIFSGKDKQFNDLSVPVELARTAVNQETAVLDAARLDAVSFVQQIHGIHELVEATTQVTTQATTQTVTTLMMIMNKLSTVRGPIKLHTLFSVF